MSRKKTIYHFRGYKIENVNDIPSESHWAVIVNNTVKIDLSGISDVKPESSNVDIIDYYVFKDDEQDKMQELVNLFYNENPQRKDIKINKVIPLEHEVRFVVDIEKLLTKTTIENKTEKVKEDTPDVAN